MKAIIYAEISKRAGQISQNFTQKFAAYVQERLEGRNAKFIDENYPGGIQNTNYNITMYKDTINVFKDVLCKATLAAGNWNITDEFLSKNVTIRCDTQTLSYLKGNSGRCTMEITGAFKASMRSSKLVLSNYKLTYIVDSFPGVSSSDVFTFFTTYFSQDVYMSFRNSIIEGLIYREIYPMLTYMKFLA